jgi:hypothetical protein
MDPMHSASSGMDGHEVPAHPKSAPSHTPAPARKHSRPSSGSACRGNVDLVSLRARVMRQGVRHFPCGLMTLSGARSGPALFYRYGIANVRVACLAAVGVTGGSFSALGRTASSPNRSASTATERATSIGEPVTGTDRQGTLRARQSRTLLPTECNARGR